MGECKHCNKHFERKYDVKRHEETCKNNPSDNKVECDHCGKEFTRKDNMERHKKEFKKEVSEEERILDKQIML